VHEAGMNELSETPSQQRIDRIPRLAAVTILGLAGVLCIVTLLSLWLGHEPRKTASIALAASGLGLMGITEVRWAERWPKRLRSLLRLTGYFSLGVGIVIRFVRL
jgi:hypothetical protein